MDRFFLKEIIHIHIIYILSHPIKFLICTSFTHSNTKTSIATIPTVSTILHFNIYIVFFGRHDGDEDEYDVVTMFQAIRDMHRNHEEEESSRFLRESSTCPTKEEEPQGILFGKYEIRRLLGFGGFAKVYEAVNVITEQSVAVKVLSRRKIVKAGFAAHIEREIAIMRRMRHPNIVTLHEVLATRTKIFFVMEFASGGELFQKIATGRFSEDLSRRYFHQLISAVQYCHSLGVFHRDLKIDNLLLDEDLNLKVSDFGLSATLDEIRPDGSLHTLCGTPAYLAPEILAKRGYDGSKIDVWSCGVVLFVLAVGYLPFNDSNVTNMFRKIQRGQFRIPNWISPDLKFFLRRLLDPNPNTRISIHEILEDPWFKNGYKEIRPMKSEEEESTTTTTRAKRLNAFDLISFSSGLDISGLFVPDPGEMDMMERIVSREKPKKIMEIAEEIAEKEEEHVRVTCKKDGFLGAKIEGQDGKFVIFLSVYRLTDELIVVEVKKKEREGGSGARFWKDKFRPRMMQLEYKPESPVNR